MKITFVYPDIIYAHITSWKGTYYSGIGYLSAVLKLAGHQVSLLHITRTISEEQYIEQIRVQSPDLIAFSSTTNMFPYVETWAAWTKKHFNLLTICGGKHPTLNPNETLSVPGIDMICIGEGEEALVELCDKLEKGGDVTSIKNIWVKKNGTVYKNPIRPLIENLDSLPFPDRDIFDHKNLNVSKDGIGIFMASRGCPYNCSYCCNHALREIYTDVGKSKYIRFRSVDNVISEIEMVLKEHPYIKIIHFDDDILPLNKRWFREFAAKYKECIGLPLHCNMRANLVTDEVIELLKEAQCEMIALGVESGNDYMANDILTRGLTSKELIRASAMCKNAGIKLYSFNMVGLPFEDMSMALETVKLNARICPDFIQVSIFYPYEHTALYALCEKNGFLTKKQLTSYFEDDSVLSQPTISTKQVVFLKNYFKLLIKVYQTLFKLPAALSRRMTAILDEILSSKVVSTIVFPLLNDTFKALRLIKHRIARN